MNQFIGMVGALILIVGFIYLLRKNVAEPDESLEVELHRLCRGDKEMMERLISHEHEKRQGRTRATAMRAAIESIKRDNR